MGGYVIGTFLKMCDAILSFKELLSASWQNVNSSTY